MVLQFWILWVASEPRSYAGVRLRSVPLVIFAATGLIVTQGGLAGVCLAWAPIAWEPGFGRSG